LPKHGYAKAQGLDNPPKPRWITQKANTMKLKLDEKGNVIVSDGKPVYVKDDGSEVAFDVAGTLTNISRLNGEAKANREAKEAAEAKLSAFAGIDDPALALKAISTMKNLDDKKLVDAGEVEKIRVDAIKSMEARYEPIVKERDTIRAQLHQEVIGGSFARSKFASEKLAIPVDLVEARFGKYFEMNEGKIIAKDTNGNPIYSPSNPAQYASFDEALEFHVNAYPQKDSILKGTGSSGAGTQSSNGSQTTKTISRSQFESLSQPDRMTAVNGGVKVVD
jgi:hypothetical protein